jgi:hypothetical protein
LKRALRCRLTRRWRLHFDKEHRIRCRVAACGAQQRVARPALAYGADAVRQAIADSMLKLPRRMRQSLTWDHGAQMSPKGFVWLNRTSGSLMVGFGVLLAMLRRPTA